MTNAVKIIEPGDVRQSTWAGARGIREGLSAEVILELIYIYSKNSVMPRAGVGKEQRWGGAGVSEEQQAGQVPRMRWAEMGATVANEAAEGG